MHIFGWQLKENNPKPFKSIQYHTGQVTSLAVMGDRIFSTGNDKTICVSDRESEDLLYRFTGHEDVINDIVLHGETLISASSDQSIVIWNLQIILAPPLFVACCDRDNYLEYYDHSIKEMTTTEDIMHRNAFHFVASYGSLECINYLMQKFNFDLAATNVNGERYSRLKIRKIMSTRKRQRLKILSSFLRERGNDVVVSSLAQETGQNFQSTHTSSSAAYYLFKNKRWRILDTLTIKDWDFKTLQYLCHKAQEDDLVYYQGLESSCGSLPILEILASTFCTNSPPIKVINFVTQSKVFNVKINDERDEKHRTLLHYRYGYNWS